MITGMSVVAGSACSPASSPKPSRLGIITSVRTRSGGFARASSSATAPSARGLRPRSGSPAATRCSRACPRCRRRRARAGAVARAPAARRGAVLRVQPAQRLGHERPRRSAARRRRPSGAPATCSARQVLGAERDPDARTSSPPPARCSTPTDAAVQRGQLGDQRQPDARCPRGVRERAPTTRWKRSNSRCWSAGVDADAGVGDRQLDAVVGRAAARTVIRPSKVNFSALDSRFRTILAHISPST